MSEENPVQTEINNPEALQRTLADRFRKRRSRAIEEKDARKRWQADFDLERLSKSGGLIDVHEKRPFVDCETAEELLHTCRTFAHAFQKQETACPDIQEGETIDQFCRRVTRLWYDRAVLRIGFFVGLKTQRFDDDMGIRRDDEFNFEDWPTWPELQEAVDVSKLPVISKPQPKWKLAGFSCYRDWVEHEEVQKRRRELAEQLNEQFKSQESEKGDADDVPRLFYRAGLNE